MLIIGVGVSCYGTIYSILWGGFFSNQSRRMVAVEIMVNEMIKKMYLIFILAIASLTGCSDDNSPNESVKMPEINDKNCSIESVKAISNKSIQEQVVSQCIRRGEFKRSPIKSW